MTIWLWIGFVALIFALMALDLGVLNRKDHVIGAREALIWTLFWIGLSLAFNVLVYFMYEGHWLGIGIVEGKEALLELPKGAQILPPIPEGDGSISYRVPGSVAALEFLTGYLIEKSLSLDNIFVIALIFRFFNVPMQFQHRVLFWGIVGALVMRGAMIGAGVALIQRFSWAIYVFGGFLVLTAIKMLVSPDVEPDLENMRLVKLARRLYPVSTELDGHRFFTRIPNGRRAMTPLFLVLLIVESSDVLFAVDSIPAIFAVTRDPFIVFTSNIFAILGLRSLYFALAQLLHKFHYLQLSLVVILAYVGVKMLLSHHFPIPAWVSLCVITGVLLLGVVGSLLRARFHKPDDDDPDAGKPDAGKPDAEGEELDSDGKPDA
jgi:tellurite resistance protein TerC